MPCPELGLGPEVHVIYFTPFGCSFEELWPFFFWTERPRDYPSSVIRLVPRVPMGGRPFAQSFEMKTSRKGAWTRCWDEEVTLYSSRLFVAFSRTVIRMENILPPLSHRR